MSNKWLIIPTILIFVCIIFTVVQGVKMNGPESITERHNMVSVMDDGRYLMETPDGNLYLLDYHRQDLEMVDFIEVQRETKGNLLASFFYVVLGMTSAFSLLLLVVGAWDDRKSITHN